MSLMQWLHAITNPGGYVLGRAVEESYSSYQAAEEQSALEAAIAGAGRGFAGGGAEVGAALQGGARGTVQGGAEAVVAPIQTPGVVSGFFGLGSGQTAGERALGLARLVLLLAPLGLLGWGAYRLLGGIGRATVAVAPSAFQAGAQVGTAAVSNVGAVAGAVKAVRGM